MAIFQHSSPFYYKCTKRSIANAVLQLATLLTIYCDVDVGSGCQQNGGLFLASVKRFTFSVYEEQFT